MSLKDIFSELNDIPNLTQDQKKALVSIFSCEDTSNAVYKILMSDNSINQHIMSWIWLWEDITLKIKDFFEQDFFDKKTFFVELKSFFESNFNNLKTVIYLSNNEFSDVRVVSDERNNAINPYLLSNKFFNSFKTIDDFSIDLINNQAFYAIKTVYWVVTFLFSKDNSINNDDIENEFLKIRKLFRRQLLSTKIAQTCKYIDWTFSDFLTWTLKVDYLNKVPQDSKYSIIYLDIDDFKYINDTYWHKQWDLYLKKFSEILKLSLRDTDKIVRYWWDEFVILVDTIDYKELLAIATRLKTQISTTSIELSNQLNNTRSREWFSSSIWYALFNEWSNISELINDADLEMYERKKSRKKPHIKIPQVNKDKLERVKQ